MKNKIDDKSIKSGMLIFKRVELEKTVMACREKNPTVFKSTLKKDFQITGDFVLSSFPSVRLKEIANSLKTKIIMAESFS
jgi:hypothetical protein